MGCICLGFALCNHELFELGVNQLESCLWLIVMKGLAI